MATTSSGKKAASGSENGAQHVVVLFCGVNGEHQIKSPPLDAPSAQRELRLLNAQRSKGGDFIRPWALVPAQAVLAAWLEDA